MCTGAGTVAPFAGVQITTDTVLGAGQVLDTAVTVTEALALCIGSATLVAVTVCVPAVSGPVYRPALLIVPICTLPPAIPSTLQVTDVFVAFVTVALNCCVLPAATDAVLG